VKFTVRFEEYRFAGVVQRMITIEGTTIRGTATEQQTGGWAWFLRYPDGHAAGKGRYASWGGVLCGIEYALAQELWYGRLDHLRRGDVRYDRGSRDAVSIRKVLSRWGWTSA
jgi:hypothetical protein